MLSKRGMTIVMMMMMRLPTSGKYALWI
jgi:hypothetical protein